MPQPLLPIRSSGIRDNLERGSVGEFLRDKIQQGSTLAIVSAYFTIYAYAALQSKLAGQRRSAPNRRPPGHRVLQAFIEQTGNPAARAEAEKVIQSLL